MSEERLAAMMGRVFGDELVPESTPACEIVPVALEDGELLERAFGHRNGDDFRALFEGSWEGRYPSQSEADMALATHLAWLTGRDPLRVDRLFRSSGLSREKWNAKRGETTYGAQTVARACAITTETFAGPIGKAKPVTEADLVTANGKDDGSGSGELEPRETEDLHVYTPLELETFLASPPPEPDWDWRGFHARGDVVLEAGDPGVGKSMTVLERAVKAATGGGEHLAEPVIARRVLFVDLESPEDVVYARLWAFGLRGEVDGFAYLHRPPGFNLLEPASLARFRETLIRNRAELAFVDSLRRAAPALDENDSRAVSTLFTALREIAAELTVTIVVVHHPRKPVGDTKVEALYAARGSGDLIGSVDSYLFYRRLAGGLIRIEHGKARRGREHDDVHFRIVEDEAGSPVIDHVTVEPGSSDEELETEVLTFVSEHPGASTKQVEDAVTGGRTAVRNALGRLSRPGDSQSVAAGPGRHPHGKYWYPLNHAGLESPGDLLATLGDISPGLSQGRESPVSPAPRRGGRVTGRLDGQRRIKR